MIRNLRIAHRAILFFSLLGAITIALGIYAILQLTTISKSVSYLGEHRLPQTVVISELMISMLTMRMHSLNVSIYPEPKQKEHYIAQIQTVRQNYHRLQEELERLAMSAEAKALVDVIRKDKKQYDQLMDQWLTLEMEGKTQEASRMRADQMRPLANRLMHELTDMKNFALKRGQDTANETKQLNSSAIWSIGVAIVLASLLVATLAIIFSRSIVVPLAQAVNTAKDIAGGNLSKDIDDVGQDEAHAMMMALKDMQEHLRNTINHIATSAEQLAGTSEELSIVTNDASKILHDQETQLELAVTAVNELTAAIDDVAHNASATSEFSEQANSKAQIGQAALMKTVETIHNLADEINHATQGIVSLAGNVQEIGQVLDVIRGIAEQTNLLALNAAIEAARAGDMGRGFAVVADEVRALAHRTQESTKEIERMINRVQEETKVAVTNMETSNQWTNSTIEMTQSLTEALTEITHIIGQINQQNMTIASASVQQASVAREVDNNLVSIRDLAFQTAAGANQTNASSQELASLAEKLNALLKFFRV